MRGGAPQFNTGRPYNRDEYFPPSYSHVPRYEPFDNASKHLSHVRSWDSDRSSYIGRDKSRGFGGPVYSALNRTSNSLSSFEVAKNEITSRLSTNTRMSELLSQRKQLQDEEKQKQEEINSIEKEIGDISSYLNSKDNMKLREKINSLKTSKGIEFYIKEYIKLKSSYNSKDVDKLREDAIKQLDIDIANKEYTLKRMDDDFSESTQNLEKLKVQLTTLLKRKKLTQSRIQINDNNKINYIDEAVDKVLIEKEIILDDKDKDKLVADIKRIYKVNKVGGYKSIKRVVKKPTTVRTKRPTKKPVKKPTTIPTKRPSKPSAKPTKRPAKPTKRPVRK